MSSFGLLTRLPGWNKLVMIIKFVKLWERKRDLGDKMKTLLTMASLMVVLPSYGQDPVTADDAEQREGTIVEVRPKKGGRLELVIQLGHTTSKEDRVVFSAYAQTMIYQLGERHLKLFKEDDKFEQIVRDSNSYRRQLTDIRNAERNRVLAEAYPKEGRSVGDADEAITKARDTFLRGEEQRRIAYGQPVKLKVGQKVIAVVSKKGDDTLGIFVTESPKSKSTKK